MNIRKVLTKDRLRRPPLRVQLTVLYAGLFVALVAAVLGVSGLLVRHSAGVAPGTSGGHSSAGSQGVSATHQFEVGPAVVGLIAVLVALWLAWWIAGRFLRPLRSMNTTAQEISATNLHRRLGLDGPDDELTELGRTLDALFGRLEASFESQRHFVANASHELRTPLAGQRTLLQVALADPGASAESLRAACEEALQLGEQQERLIDAFLTLATSERGLDRLEQLDLSTVVDDVLHGRHPEIGELGLDIRTALMPAPFAGDPRLAERLFANLFDNALRHNVVGGDVLVSTRTESGHAVLSVTNSGPIIPQEHVERLFQPFQQIGSERVRHAAGHGLGLAIVQVIAQAHGAKVIARARPEGGLEIRVIFAPANT